MVLISFVIGIVVERSWNDIKLPFALETAVFMFGFVEIGILFRPALESYFQSDWTEAVRGRAKFAMIIAILIAIGTLASYFNGFAEVRIFQYGKFPLLFILSALSLSAAFIGLAGLFHRSRILQRVGRATMSILCLHKFPVLIFQSVIPTTKKLLAVENSIESIVASLIISILCIVLCLIADVVLTRICPEVLGKRREKL